MSLATNWACLKLSSEALAFRAADGFKKALTPSFMPLVNSGERLQTSGHSGPLRRRPPPKRPAAKPAGNQRESSNTPDKGPDTPTQTTFYSVFSHPAPAGDPTPSIGGGSTTSIAVSADGNSLTLSWDGGGSPVGLPSSAHGTWSAEPPAPTPPRLRKALNSTEWAIPRHIG